MGRVGKVMVIDTSCQPENRTYKLRLFDGDNPVGDYSDEVSVVTVP